MIWHTTFKDVLYGMMYIEQFEASGWPSHQVSVPDFGSYGPGFESRWGVLGGDSDDCTTPRCTEPFIIILPLF